MKIFIISQVSALSRRNFQMDQMRRLGLAFKFVDAFEAATLSDDDCLIAAQTWPGATKPQDVACFNSHRLVWQRIIEDGAMALVLEDDAILADTIVDSLAVIEKRHENWRHVYDLEFTPEPHIIADVPTWRDDRGFVSSRIYRNRIGLAGYILGPKAAERLLAETKQYRLIDSYLWQRRWLHGQMFEPAQVVQARFLPNVEQEPNFIRADETRVFRPRTRLRNFCLQMGIELARGLSLLKAMARSTRREPKVEWDRFPKN